MKRIGLFLLAVAMMAGLVGCAISENYVYSSPHAESVELIYKAQRWSLNIYESMNYQFTISPFNARFKSGLFMATLIPIPVNSSSFDFDKSIRFDKQSNSADPPFVVELGIYANKGDLIFDTSLVRLEVGGKQVGSSRYSLMSGVDCGGFGSSFQFSTCMSKYDPSTMPVEVVKIQKGGLMFFWLIFEVSPPPPETQFAVEINGLSIEGRSLAPVLISFSPKKVSRSDSAP